METPNFTTLMEDAELAARACYEYKLAKMACEQAYGLPFHTAKENLIDNLTIAEKNKFDLSQFRGPKSLFKFAQWETHIVYLLKYIPTYHPKLKRIDDNMKKYKQKLDMAKIEHEAEIKRLLVTNEIEMTFNKLELQFRDCK